MKISYLSLIALTCVLNLAWASAQPAPTGVTPVDETTDTVPTELEAFRASVAEAMPGVALDEIVPEETPDLYAPEAEPEVAVEVIEPPPAELQTPRVAIFVKNQSTKRYLDDEIDPLRDYVSAELAGEGMIVLDAKEIAESFTRYKITTQEERLGLVDGLFNGGSVIRVGQMIGADYIAVVSLLNADVRSRTMNGRSVNTYECRYSFRVYEATQGTSVFGNNGSATYPVTTDVSGTDDMTYFHDVAEQAARKVAAAMIASAPKWRSPAPRETQLVSFKISTTIDGLINGLENGVRAPNDVLDEMRRIVGGVTVELDGAALGTSPGTFKASPGLHQLRLTRQWMQPWQKTVQIVEGAEFNVGLELSTEGLAKFQSLEGFRAAVAVAYAEAAWRKGIKVNFDTSAWQDVVLENKAIRQEGFINQAE